MNIFLVIILVLLVLGGGGLGYSRYGVAGGLGPIGLGLIILLVLLFTGVI